jgi:NitT/TauT family transport system substrate-binding protein
MLRKRSLRSLAGVTATAAVLLAGCGTDTVQQNTDGSTTIQIAVTQWPSLVFSVPYHVAMEQGYFAEEGIEIGGVVAAQGGGTTVRSILAGDLAFGEAAASAVAESHEAGATLLAVGGGVRAVGDVVWVAPPGSPLTSIEGMAGQQVGYTNPGGVTQSLLAMSLQRAGVDPAAVDQRATGGVAEGLTAMESGGIAASIHAEPLYSGQADSYQLLFRASDYVTDFQQTVVVTSPELAERDPDLVRGFLAARGRGVQFMIDHPEEAARIWAERGGVDPAAARTAINALLAVNEWGVGFSAEGLAAAEEGMRAAGLLDAGASVPWETFVDQDYLPADVERITVP